MSKDIVTHTNECMHQLENTLKDANDDLAKVLKAVKVTCYNSNVFI